MMVRSTHDQQSLEHGRAGLPVYIAAGCRAQVPADRYETQDRSSLRARAGFFDVYSVSPMTRGFIVISSHWPGGGARHFSSFSFARRLLSGCSDRRLDTLLPGSRAATYCARNGRIRQAAVAFFGGLPSLNLSAPCSRAAAFRKHRNCQVVDASRRTQERHSSASVAYVQQPNERQREACSLNQRVRLP